MQQTRNANKNKHEFRKNVLFVLIIIPMNERWSSTSPPKSDSICAAPPILQVCQPHRQCERFCHNSSFWAFTWNMRNFIVNFFIKKNHSHFDFTLALTSLASLSPLSSSFVIESTRCQFVYLPCLIYKHLWRPSHHRKLWSRRKTLPERPRQLKMRPTKCRKFAEPAWCRTTRCDRSINADRFAGKLHDSPICWPIARDWRYLKIIIISNPVL